MSVLSSSLLESLQRLPAFHGDVIVTEVNSAGSLPVRVNGSLCFGVAPRARQLYVQTDRVVQGSNDLFVQLSKWRPVAGPNAIDSIVVNGWKLGSSMLEGSFNLPTEQLAMVSSQEANCPVAAFLIDAKLTNERSAAGSIAIRGAELDQTLFTNISPIGTGCPIHPSWQTAHSTIEGRMLVVASLETGNLSRLPGSWNVWRHGRHIGGAELVGGLFQLDSSGYAVQGHAFGHAAVLAKSFAVSPIEFQRIATLNKLRTKFDITTEITLNKGQWHEKDKSILIHAANRLYQKIFPAERFRFKLGKETKHGD